MPIIVVFGGTGRQGGNVVKALLKDGRWNVRVLARNATSKKAVRFLNRGVEILQGNMQNVDDLRKLMQGAYGVFAVTNYWDPESMGKEEQIGKQIAEIAKECGVSHFIWSTLPNVEKITGGKYLVPHFTHKARVNRHIKRLGFDCYTFLMAPFYYQNFGTFFAPRKEGNKLVWTIPMAETAYITAFDVKDIGPVTLTVLLNRTAFHRKKIPLAAEHMHPQDYIIKMALLYKTQAKIALVRPEEYERMGFPNAQELAEMCKYFEEYTYFGGMYDICEGKRIYPALKSWVQYLQEELAAVQSE